MTNNDLYKSLLNILRKESKGLAVSPDAFTDYLKVENLALFNDYYKVFEQTRIVSDAIKHLKTSSTRTLTIGYVSAPGDYAHLTALHVGSETTLIDEVTDEEWVFRADDALTVPTEDYPIARLADTNIYVLPNTIDSITVLYLRNPTTPYFDYYTDVNLNIQYLTAGQSYALQASEVYRDGTTVGTMSSLTVELEWQDLDKIKILHRILTKFGVSMDEQLVAQYATSKENS